MLLPALDALEAPLGPIKTTASCQTAHVTAWQTLGDVTSKYGEKGVLGKIIFALAQPWSTQHFRGPLHRCYNTDRTMPQASIARPASPIALGLPQLTEPADAWFFKALAAEFLATLLFLFITISTAGVRGCTSPRLRRGSQPCSHWLVPAFDAMQRNDSELLSSCSHSC